MGGEYQPKEGGVTPDRKCIVNGHKVTEYYWAGRMVTYVDNRASELSYEDAVAAAKSTPELPEQSA